MTLSLFHDQSFSQPFAILGKTVTNRVIVRFPILVMYCLMFLDMISYCKVATEFNSSNCYYMVKYLAYSFMIVIAIE
jgi:hypothetical protein